MVMPPAIPDLWRDKEDAARLYQLYLSRLHQNHLYERIVSSCRQIRRYAARGPGSKEGLFTFSFEIDALCELQDYKTAWRQHRLREQIVFGERFNLIHRQWSPDDEYVLAHYYAPLLYFLGRYRQGCSLLEISLGFWFNGRNVRSYDILHYIYKGNQEPWDRYDVTLSHFYDRLGKELSSWQHWEAYVHGFHPRLFRLSGVRRDELLRDAGQLTVFFDKLRAIQAERTTSGVTWGQSDLIESAAKVRKRQEATQRKRDEFNEQTKAVRERTNRKLRELFPELQGLPR